MTENSPTLADGTRGRSIRSRDRRLMRPFIGTHRRIIRASRGRILGHMGGNPLLILTTTGRRTGQPHANPVIGIPDGDDWLIVASNGGAATQPLWVRNVAAQPHVTATCRGQTDHYLARILPPDERNASWPALVRAYPAYARMQAKTDRQLPIVRLEPVPR
ncbi:MAG: nitroreductase family deazaflavin-dependent oxidoreductase [Actinobacteria bacterium]|jgi:deazaflavin-dependent oxidoreductase (nitroreductase family)|nr:nitroreductase family deazaflavin-dependent oxidoreductase [Actinomycetota bacterium]